MGHKLNSSALLRRLASRKVQPWISAHDSDTQSSLYSSLTPPSFSETRNEVPVTMQLHPDIQHDHLDRLAPDRISFDSAGPAVVAQCDTIRQAARLNLTGKALPSQQTPNHINPLREHYPTQRTPLTFPEDPPPAYNPNHCISNWGSDARRRIFYDPVRDDSYVKSEPGTVSDLDMAELERGDDQVRPAAPPADPMELSGSPTLASSCLATPIIAISESEGSTSDLLNEQRRLFRALEKICVTATRIYWIYTRPSPQVYLRYSHRPGRSTPYDRYLGSSRSSRRVLSRRILREIDSEDSRLTLRDLLSRICNQMWERAMQMDSQQEEELAVNRMMNLYSWAHCLSRATTKVEVEREALGEGDIVPVFLAARDMAGFLLFEEGKEEVEELWGTYGFGGRMEDFEWEHEG
jgi:hypothetical protein